MPVQAHAGRIETNASAVRRSQVCIDEAIPLDDAVDLDVDPAREHRPGRDERVEVAVLPAPIDRDRQLRQQRRIEETTGERRIETCRVDAG